MHPCPAFITLAVRAGPGYIGVKAGAMVLPANRPSRATLQGVNQMSKVAKVATIAIAPAHPAGQGHSTQGGHVIAWRAQPRFALSDTLTLVAGTNPWRPGTPSAAFYNQVLAAMPAGSTVAQCLEFAKATVGNKSGRTHDQLRWLYTWGGSYLAVNGQVYNPPVAAPAPAPAAPAKARKAAKVA